MTARNGAQVLPDQALESRRLDVERQIGLGGIASQVIAQPLGPRFELLRIVFQARLRELFAQSLLERRARVSETDRANAFFCARDQQLA